MYEALPFVNHQEKRERQEKIFWKIPVNYIKSSNEGRRDEDRRTSGKNLLSTLSPRRLGSLWTYALL